MCQDRCHAHVTRVRRSLSFKCNAPTRHDDGWWLVRAGDDGETCTATDPASYDPVASVGTFAKISCAPEPATSASASAAGGCDGGRDACAPQRIEGGGSSV